MNGLVSCGSLQTWPSSPSGAGTSTISAPNLQHLGEAGGVEAAFLDSTEAAGTVLEDTNKSNNRPRPRKGPQVALSISGKDHEVAWGRAPNQVARGENESDLGRDYVGMMFGLDFPTS